MKTCVIRCRPVLLPLPLPLSLSRHFLGIIFFFFSIFFTFFALFPPISQAEASDCESGREVANGGYLVRAAGCANCHSVGPDWPFAGGVKLTTPFGDFFTPNITPDWLTGIGSWSEGQFRRALREGISPSGSIYYPAFPYRAFTKISDEDMHSMFAYLKSRVPIRMKNRDHLIAFPFNQRWLLWFWQALFFNLNPSDSIQNLRLGMGPFKPVAGHSSNWNRGAYLVEGLTHCTECHTPRNALGALDSAQWMAGSTIKFSGRLAPNITPDPVTGLGHWTTRDWTRFLSSGFTPEGSTPGVEMAEVLQDTSALTKADRAAVVEYLTQLKPIIRGSEGSDE